jgi:tripeptide aminopeptidase
MSVAAAPRISGLPAEDVPLPAVAARFCRYVRVDTQSDPASETVPSTAKQLDLSRLLADELRAMGASAVEMDAFGYVFATVPSSLPPEAAARLPVVGLVAHVDTSPDAPGKNVRPHVHAAYDGAALALPGDPSAVLDPARQPALLEHLGHDLITSDGTTLLGSDDKAGVAVIMQLAEELLATTAFLPPRASAPPRAPPCGSCSRPTRRSAAAWTTSTWSGSGPTWPTPSTGMG